MGKKEVNLKDLCLITWLGFVTVADVITTKIALVDVIGLQEAMFVADMMMQQSFYFWVLYRLITFLLLGLVAIAYLHYTNNKIVFRGLIGLPAFIGTGLTINNIVMIMMVI